MNKFFKFLTRPVAAPGSELSDFFRFILVCGTLAVLALLVGCSASAKISTETNGVRQDATDIRSEVAASHVLLKHPTTQNVAAVDKSLTTIDTKAIDIQDHADVIQTELTKVQDITPAWLTTLKWVGIGAACIAGLFIMWRLNLFIAIEKSIQFVVSFIAKLAGA